MATVGAGLQKSKARENVMALLNSSQTTTDPHIFVREITHRINNEFASAISAVSLAASQSENQEVRIALAGVLEHLWSYARVHRALQMPTADATIDASEYIGALCQSISSSKLQHRGVELVFVDQHFQLDATRCWKLGMIVNELITNAERHAFRDCGGTIRVELACSGAFVVCRVIDNGTGCEEITAGRGTAIIECLVSDLGGEIVRQCGPRGTLAKLVFPNGD
jgi:two-component sensor histidine kinase